MQDAADIPKAHLEESRFKILRQPHQCPGSLAAWARTVLDYPLFTKQPDDLSLRRHANLYAGKHSRQFYSPNAGQGRATGLADGNQ